MSLARGLLLTFVTVCEKNAAGTAKIKNNAKKLRVISTDFIKRIKNRLTGSLK
jgi:hypothetical protein